MKKSIAIALLGALMLSLTSCGANAELDALKKENNKLKQQVSELQAQLSTDKSDTPQSNNKKNLKAEWVQDDTPYTLESATAKLEILEDVSIVKSSSRDEYILVMNFIYTNNSDNAMNFINDSNLSVIPYQDGIALDTPGTTAENNLYNTNSAYKSLKQGATVQAQLAFIVPDIEKPVEVEIGHYSDYDKKIIKTIKFTK